MIAGLHDNKTIAPLIFEGNCDKDVFESYVEQILIRNLRAGQTVILDNISFYKTPRVRILIESVGCKVLYLPTYSPDLNPIENYWFKIKHNIRKISHMFTDFSDAVCFILKNVSTFVY